MSGAVAPPGTLPGVPLLADGALQLRVDPALQPLVEAWIPLQTPQGCVGEGRAELRCRPGSPPRPSGSAPRLELARVGAWRDGPSGVLLAEPGGQVGARLDLARARGELLIDPAAAHDTSEDAALQRFCALTLAAAVLLGSLGHTLVHAAAVIPPGGEGAWLLPGGTFSGKSTTCLNLVRAGWRFLADDHVVLGQRDDGRVWAEGWPRRFHLDTGYAAGMPTGRRERVDPAALVSNAWQRSAPVARLLFPHVESGAASAVVPLHAAGALARLLEASPWLLANEPAAPALLGLLRRVATLPAYALQAGLDSYADPAVLERVLEPVFSRGGETAPRVGS